MSLSIQLPDRLGPTQARLVGFIAISLALHLLTLVGAGRLDFSVKRFGDNAPPRHELHATLTSRDHTPAEPVLPPTRNEIESAKEEASQPAAAPAPGQAGAVERTGLALPAPAKWYTAQEVDVRAEPLAGVALRYPENLRGEPVAGKVRLRLFIDERGVIRKIQIASSEPPGIFDEAARRAWEDVRFSPAIKSGEAVKSQKLLELTYQPDLN